MERSMCVTAVVSAVALLLWGCATGDKSQQVIEPGGSVRDIRQETFSKGVDAYPAVSPDGKEFAYQRFQDGNYDIWAKATTSQSDSAGRQVTFHDADDRRPAWLGTDRIIFDSWRVDWNQLWKKNSAGSGGITLVSRGTHLDMDADVAKDGSIVFVSQVTESVVTHDEKGRLWLLFDSMPAIWRLDPDGAMTLLARGISPSWSPDGTRIAFASNVQGSFDVFTMTRDGGNQTQVTTHKADDVEPCWSPDGRHIAFSSNRGEKRNEDFNIWVVRADGSTPTQLTIQDGDDAGPSWGPPTIGAPQGRIYYHAYRGRDWNVWSVAPMLD